MPDFVFIRNLVLPCQIGLFSKERRKKQDVIVDLEIHCNLKKAGVSDDIGATVNYSQLIQQISGMVSKRKFRLLESVAESIASLALQDFATKEVTVRVRKKKYNRAPLIGVEITRLQHG